MLDKIAGPLTEPAPDFAEDIKPTIEHFTFLRAKIADNLLVDSGCITYVRDETTKQKKEIGHGAFGNVYAADYLGSEVAVKEVKLDVVNSESLAQFVAEAVLIARLRHPNVIQCLGIVWEIPEVSIMFELCPAGSLYDFLRKHKGQYSFGGGGGAGGTIGTRMKR